MEGELAAEARVDLVVAGSWPLTAGQRALLRHYRADLETA